MRDIISCVLLRVPPSRGTPSVTHRCTYPFNPSPLLSTPSSRYGIAHGCAQEPTRGSAVKFRGESVHKNRPLVPRSNIVGSWTRGGGVLLHSYYRGGGGAFEWLQFSSFWYPGGAFSAVQLFGRLAILETRGIIVAPSVGFDPSSTWGIWHFWIFTHFHPFPSLFTFFFAHLHHGLPHFGVGPRVGVMDTHALAWPHELT